MTSEELQLVSGFHAFRNHLLSQSMRKLDDRAHDGGRLPARVNTPDKGTVDFQCVEAKSLQIAQRREAGSEVIDREINTHCSQLLCKLRRLRGLVCEEALGDL